MSEIAWAACAAGLLSAAALPIGSAVGLSLRPRAKLTAALLAFGGGALLFALTIEIVAHSFREVGFPPLAVGCVAGGLIFEALNRALNSQGGFLRKAATISRHITTLKRRLADSMLRHLSRVRLLQALNPEEVATLVPLVETLDFAPGDTVCAEGEPGDALYLIDAGEVTVTRGGAVVSRLKAGDVFGEMALVTGGPRNATVSAATRVRLFRLRKDDFDRLLRSSPAARRQVQDLVEARTGDLAARALVSDSQAAAWKEAASAALQDQDLAPTRLEIQTKVKEHGASAALGIWLGNLLDAVPESLVIGTTVQGFGEFSWALIAGVFLANFPEAWSGSVVMNAQGYARARILLMWSSITLVGGAAAMAGSVFLRELSHAGFAVIEGVAAGAMLTMIAETMLPEAYEQGGPVVGLSTLFGFLAALFVKSIA